ncbi:hypothetical protein LL037_00280 [Clostridium estertheticum]|uniref:TolB family protein n=1 Tax=Clostridium estertheticum TaxID=238834 RepID=UPI001C0CF8A5|nr:hypothetical protein [Clostridium estertheticum]MBU3197907.1 hypothetical protein [Clostridium estertheticum]WAG65704.1 hypothetical protein LL037_00280 [Clostridium estertheticum]
MEINENSIEKSLCNDAAKIVIDEEFKSDLKNKIMFADKYNNITKQPKHKSNFMKNRYFKIASGFVICVFVSGSIFKAIDIQNKNMFTRSKGITNSATPAISPKGSLEDSSKQASGLKILDDMINNNYKNKQLAVIKGNAGSVSDIPSGNNVKKAINNLLAENVISNNAITGVVNHDNSDAQINQSQVTDVKPVIPETVIPEIVTKPTIDVPSAPLVALTTYDPRYSIDATKLASVKDDGIYIKDLKSSNEKMLIAYSDKTQVVNKPNFTPSGQIIYYKANKVALENGAIYLSSENGKVSTKIADGKNPMVSKNGKKLLYESKGQIFIQNLKDNTSSYVANGKYPAFSNDDNLISYVKEGIETSPDISPDISNVKTASFAKLATFSRMTSFAKVTSTEKTISTLCVYNILADKSYSITDNGSIADSSTESWSGAIRNVEDTSGLDATSQYSYCESIWSLDNKEVHVIKVDNETGDRVVTNFKLDN